MATESKVESEPKAPPKWVTGRAAQTISGLTLNALLKEVAVNRVRVQALPGRALKFNRDDLEKITAEADDD